MADTDETSLNSYLEHLLSLMQLLRIYKSEKELSISQKISTLFLMIMLLSGNLSLIISELADLKNVKDARELATRIGPISFHMTGIVKWSFCMSNINKITRLIESLKYCHHLTSEICQNSEEREKLHHEMEIAQRKTKLFIYLWPALGISGAMHYCSNPVSLRLYKMYVKNLDSVNISKILPIAGWFPWDNDQYYKYSYIIQVFGVLGCCVGTVSYDQLYVSTLLVISSYLKHLIYSLQGENINDGLRRISQKGKVINFEKRLKTCTAQYAEVLDYVEKLEKVGRPCMFIQCIQNIAVLCLSSFEAATLQITQDADCIMKLLTMAEFTLGVTVQLLFFCLLATYIKELGLLVGDAVYASEWVSSFNALGNKEGTDTENHKVKYSVLMMTIRSQRPILLTGGPFYILSLETFKAIIGLAMSNAIILSQLYEDK